ncbi:SNF-related serine/threonine-protein kinase [Tribolium madens]|uniref:SNF-related serine/threonine-protein kinase n=1 Tax=Tribolium madens TaxID=41895 RepID=UPI001CF75FDA|nr:SNF-related serine/threonine-protein kinase [Tribolium madens]XP_044259084.1 SNF-related serine/threonine-protein kinase [Tribolium madens]XP_044259093.1 SNF-related serine/threonine-protein kinase [Tribolium madens]XP_044259102.1 SNF-related serine/threonine-protein kinase [Tribolium madens]
MHRSLRIGSGPLDGNSLSALRSGPYEGKIAGLYDLEETLGRGHFAVVKLARHVFTGEKVAVKVIDKSKLDEVSKAHLFQEVRCMKLVQHPNVVRLYEVIDTATKLYLILELGDGGDLYDYIMRHDTGLSEQLAKEYFRQIVRAISYCHQLHVVHRDLKPENVVFFEKLGVVKLTDFGFSNKFCPGQKLETSCGSLAYSAPEILLGDSYDAPAVDIWSLGVILYMLVCGQAPFQEANDSETLTMIMDCKYSVPPHVSKDCQDLIARMLVRNPEKRATLAEIANHKWLKIDKQDNPPIDTLPLVSREQLSEEDHNLIVQKIVNGNIATKEEIQECLDKNEYNHITATYYLLAERKLRAKRQDQANKNKRPEHLAVPHNSPAPKRDNNGTGPTPCLLTVPRTPGDVPQRSRKCSIVQEDEEEEDISSCSGREELVPPLNRRGSRSEGRLNLALQERLAESERLKPITDKIESIDAKPKVQVRQPNDKPQTNMKWRMEKSSSLVESKIIKDMVPKTDATTTTIITDSSTISIPIITTNSPLSQTIPKYKTMPSPTRTTGLSGGSPLQLNEIFEEGDGQETPRPTSRQFLRNQNRTSYEQRRSKFHKARTASCSSSDASDDDSEKRKKRAHKLTNASAKPFQGRRDSHDDSSDSQEPSTGTGTSGNNNKITTTGQNTSNSQQHKNGSTGGNTTGGRKNTNIRHKAGRRRNGETRLRESQSLNRITEVQEDGAHALVIATSVVGTQGVMNPKVKGIGARILQGFNNMSKKNQEEKVTHISRKDTVKSADFDGIEIENKIVSERSGLKKMRLLGKYFQVHKKLCIPLPGLFTRNRLYKAQSCSSLSRDKIALNPETVMRCRQRAVSVIRNSDGDINQNDKPRRKSSTVVQLNNVCTELTGICAVHLGQASKCCSFC